MARLKIYDKRRQHNRVKSAPSYYILRIYKLMLLEKKDWKSKELMLSVGGNNSYFLDGANCLISLGLIEKIKVTNRKENCYKYKLKSKRGVKK